MNLKEEKARTALYRSLLGMLDHAALEDISIRDLCDTAKVSRSTFYMHYKHPEDILRFEYMKAHEEAFGTSEWSLEYLMGNDFIKDMVSFFDKNTQLLSLISRWNLIDYVARIPTQVSYDDAQNLQDDTFSQYPQYTVIYLWGRFFNVCMGWIIFGKKETAEEIVHILSEMAKW